MSVGPRIDESHGTASRGRRAPRARARRAASETTGSRSTASRTTRVSCAGTRWKRSAARGALLVLRAGDVDDEAKQCALDGRRRRPWARSPSRAHAAPRRAVVGRRTVDDAQSHDVAGAVEAEHRREVDQHVEGEALGGGQRVVWIDGEHVARRDESDEACGVAPAVYECPYEAASARSEHAARDALDHPHTTGKSTASPTPTLLDDPQEAPPDRTPRALRLAAQPDQGVGVSHLSPLSDRQGGEARVRRHRRRRGGRAGGSRRDRIARDGDGSLDQDRTPLERRHDELRRVRADPDRRGRAHPRAGVRRRPFTCRSRASRWAAARSSCSSRRSIRRSR